MSIGQIADPLVNKGIRFRIFRGAGNEIQPFVFPQGESEGDFAPLFGDRLDRVVIRREAGINGRRRAVLSRRRADIQAAALCVVQLSVLNRHARKGVQFFCYGLHDGQRILAAGIGGKVSFRAGEIAVCPVGKGKSFADLGKTAVLVLAVRGGVKVYGVFLRSGDHAHVRQVEAEGGGKAAHRRRYDYGIRKVGGDPRNGRRVQNVGIHFKEPDVFYVRHEPVRLFFQRGGNGEKIVEGQFSAPEFGENVFYERFDGARIILRDPLFRVEHFGDVAHLHLFIGVIAYARDGADHNERVNYDRQNDEQQFAAEAQIRFYHNKLLIRGLGALSLR